MRGTVFAVIRIADDAEFFNARNGSAFRGYEVIGSYATLRAAKIARNEEQGRVYVTERRGG